jgi:hypothetical protein
MEWKLKERRRKRFDGDFYKPVKMCICVHACSELWLQHYLCMADPSVYQLILTSQHSEGGVKVETSDW